MAESHDPIRRALLRRAALGLSLAATSARSDRAAAAATHGNLPLLDPNDPAARKVQYVADASQSKAAEPGANCASCGLYAGQTQTSGSCSLFANNWVAASGWCSAWVSL